MTLFNIQTTNQTVLVTNFEVVSVTPELTNFSLSRSCFIGKCDNMLYCPILAQGKYI